MREIDFRGKSKRSGKWYYGNLIIKKKRLSVQALDEEMLEYKYSIQYLNENNKMGIVEVDERTVGQFVGEGEYGKIYEGMRLYDEYEEAYCTVEYDEEECRYMLAYDGYIERIESLDGLQIAEEDKQ